MSEMEKTGREGTKAVAIKGADPSSDSATPKIIAKGTGNLAERILDIAFAEGVKVRQDKDLTELLDAFDVDSPVPLEALHAVSLILERVYAENQRMADMEDEDMVAQNASGPIKNTALDASTGEQIPVEESQPPAKPKGFS